MSLAVLLFVIAVLLFIGAAAVEELRHRNHTAAAVDAGLALATLALAIALGVL